MSQLFPTFTSSDKELDITYQYRCDAYAMHIKDTPDGRVVTEFLPDVPWAGIYNTINCAAQHHFRDGRWMRDPSVMYEYANFWCTAGNPRLYSFPISDSFLRLAQVTGDCGFAEDAYPTLVSVHDGWDDHKTQDGMYDQDCGHDGMEFSISGDGIRPTLNAYMYADKMALAYLAQRMGKLDEAENFLTSAKTLAEQINEKLWNPAIGMFGVISRKGELQNVREQVGYIPWMYGIPTEGKDECFKYLLDPACFAAPYGLRTADASHPAYQQPIHHECLWNGPIWPFATSQTLTAVMTYLQTAEHPTVTPEDFTKMLLTYAYSHRDTDGTPCLDENMHPDTGIWLAREILRSWGRRDRGMHYNHSSFIDLVITGICGICPSVDSKLTVSPLGTSLDAFSLQGVVYHGHDISVEWKADEGLSVVIDGKHKYFAEATQRPTIEIDLDKLA